MSSSDSVLIRFSPDAHANDAPPATANVATTIVVDGPRGRSTITTDSGLHAQLAIPFAPRAGEDPGWPATYYEQPYQGSPHGGVVLEMIADEGAFTCSGDLYNLGGTSPIWNLGQGPNLFLYSQGVAGLRGGYVVWLTWIYDLGFVASYLTDQINYLHSLQPSVYPAACTEGWDVHPHIRFRPVARPAGASIRWRVRHYHNLFRAFSVTQDYVPACDSFVTINRQYIDTSTTLGYYVETRDPANGVSADDGTYLLGQDTTAWQTMVLAGNQSGDYVGEDHPANPGSLIGICDQVGNLIA